MGCNGLSRRNERKWAHTKCDHDTHRLTADPAGLHQLWCREPRTTFVAPAHSHLPEREIPSASPYGRYAKMIIMPNSKDGVFLRSICFST